mmetsp:Transcript_12806/g.18690  ORF Transcript_12806/g.18690 Transcript_12806/m.18690 type:complete len:134 (+) Transcript_12806:1325-1726(+)
MCKIPEAKPKLERIKPNKTMISFQFQVLICIPKIIIPTENPPSRPPTCAAQSTYGMKLNTNIKTTLHKVDPNCSHNIAWLNSRSWDLVDSLDRQSASASFAPNKPQTLLDDPTPTEFGAWMTLNMLPDAALAR